MTDVIESNLATKQDLNDFRAATKQDLNDFRAVTKQDLNDFRLAAKQDLSDLRNYTDLRLQRFESEMEKLEYRLTIKLGTIVSISVGVAVALAKLI